MSIIARLYYGIPRFCGEAFRATKAPTLLLLFCLFGLPLLSSAILTTLTVVTRSNVPGKVMEAAYTFAEEGFNPRAADHPTPTTLSILDSLTSGQKRIAKRVSYILYADIIAFFVAGTWWVSRAWRFLRHFASTGL